MNNYKITEELGSINFGYSSNEKCAVCGEFNNNQSEPRFGYTVCINHQHIPPQEINELCCE